MKDQRKSKDTVFDRVPPQSLEAERAVLGSIMLDNDCIGRVIELLDERCFYRTSNQKIYSAVLTLFERNEPVDLITLSEVLKRTKMLDEIGGAYYLTELAESVPSAANVEYHARIVLERYLLRMLITESAGIAQDCFESNENVFDLLDRAEQRIFRLSERRLSNTFQHIDKIMHGAMEKVESFHARQGMVTGVPTGFTQLDELTSGFQNGELIVVAGRPSMGKTAFCLNIARNAAILGQFPVGIFSLEMSREQLALRLLCAEARVDAHRVRTGTLADDQWKNLSACVGTLTEAPIFIDDTPAMTVLEMRAKARRLKKEKNLGMLVIDYMQLMQGPRGVESRQQEISAISRSLKALSKELDIPVVALSQLSRAVESRGGDKRPMLSDLRESGAIEQDADVVIFIYRPEFYGIAVNDDGQSVEGRAEIIIGKQRNGPVGTIHLSFVKQWAKFENYITERQDAPF
ncbi:replicative DNA helicase [candidate division KSB1 bacterium]|nr:replicative DNA helicase [candidate division KSB1 bacterium]